MAKQKRVNSVVVRNRDQIQSYIMTTAKYDFNVYEKRIIYRLVEMAQSEVMGRRFPDDCRKIEHNLFGYTKITMPTSDILNGEDDKNHAQVKLALTRLNEKKFEYEDDEIWQIIRIVDRVIVEKNKSIFSFEVEPKIWSCILDFSKGYRKYELTTAMQFKSVYSMRFYELLSGQETPLTYSIEQLRDMFQLQGKYKQINDLQRFVLEPAQRELDEYSPYSFTYKIGKTGRKYTTITFFPKFIRKNRDEELEIKELKQKVSLSWSLSPEITNYLQQALQFTLKEIKSNRDLFIEAQDKFPDFIETLALLNGKSRDKKNPKGWIIKAIQGKLNDLKK